MPDKDNKYDLDEVGKEWNDLFIDEQHVDAINLNGTTISSTAANIKLDGLWLIKIRVLNWQRFKSKSGVTATEFD